MAELFGAQRLILQAINDLPKDFAGYVTDSQIAESTKMELGDVREWIQTLEERGYVDVAPIKTGLSVQIRAKGRLELRSSPQPYPTLAPTPTSPSRRAISISCSALIAISFLLLIDIIMWIHRGQRVPHNIPPELPVTKNRINHKECEHIFELCIKSKRFDDAEKVAKKCWEGEEQKKKLDRIEHERLQQ